MENKYESLFIKLGITGTLLYLLAKTFGKPFRWFMILLLIWFGFKVVAPTVIHFLAPAIGATINSLHDAGKTISTVCGCK